MASGHPYMVVEYVSPRPGRDVGATFKRSNFACQACHLPLDGDNPRLLNYKPLPVDCRACHTNEPAPAGGRS